MNPYGGTPPTHAMMFSRMVDRFEHKKRDVKFRLNDLVDDLFGFLLAEVTSILPPTSVGPIMPPPQFGPRGPMPGMNGGPPMMRPPNGFLPPHMKPQNGLPPMGAPMLIPKQHQNGVGPMLMGPPGIPVQQHSLPQPPAPKVSQSQPQQSQQQQPTTITIKEEIHEEEEPQYLPSNSESSLAEPNSEMDVLPEGYPDSYPEIPHHPDHIEGDEECTCPDCIDEDLALKVECDLLEVELPEGSSGLAGNYNTDGSPARKRCRQSRAPPAADGSLPAGGDGAYLVNPAIEQENRIVTLGLRCWLEGCGSMCEDRPKLNQHLMVVHGVMPYRCRIAGCNHTFVSFTECGNHRRNEHYGVNDFPCTQCNKSYNRYHTLFDHQYQYHEEGLFRCSKEGCDFLASFREQVYKHYSREHAKFVCPVEGCGQAFDFSSLLKRHERTHSSVKPYRCKFPGCDYESRLKGATVTHVRIAHFNLPGTVKRQKELGIVDERDPNEFIEEQTELLN